MSTKSDRTPYPWDELDHKWELEQMTIEQVVGQLIVWGAQHEDRLVTLMRELEGIAHSVADLDARVQGIEAAQG